MHWRWERAGLVLDGGPGLSRRRDDRWIQKAARFRQGLQGCLEPLEYWALSEQSPDVFYAYRLFDAREDEEKNLLPHEVEARLLCRQTPEAIAGRCGMEPAAVAAYEALFFNVSDRLQQRSYILHQVLGRAVQAGIRERAYDLIWKLYAYKGGPYVLDMMVETMGDLGWPESPDEVGGWLRDAFQGQLARKAALAAQTMDASNGFTQVDIVMAYLKLCEAESNRDGAGKGAQATILSNIQVMLERVPFAVGARPAGEASGPDLRLSAEYAAEPRGEELLQLAVGEEPARLAQIEDLSFPALPGRVRQALEARGEPE